MTSLSTVAVNPVAADEAKRLRATVSAYSTHLLLTDGEIRAELTPEGCAAFIARAVEWARSMQTPT